MTEKKAPSGPSDLASQFPNLYSLFKSLPISNDLKQKVRSASPPDPQTTKSLLSLAQIVEKALSGKK